jgi:ABC-type spermidine/putrescine transport system permease subunit II
VRRSAPAWTALKVIVALVYVFMLGPIVITAVVSFNATNRSVNTPDGLSLRWWAVAL